MEEVPICESVYCPEVVLVVLLFHLLCVLNPAATIRSSEGSRAAPAAPVFVDVDDWGHP